MKQLAEAAIRDSFINCSKGESRRISLPREVEELPWKHLDFLGWTDPRAPERSYLVWQQGEDDAPIGVMLRNPDRLPGLQRNMCSLCLTTHGSGGVTLMAARKSGPAGRKGDTVGLYMCADLNCSLYVRGLKALPPGLRMEETLTVPEKVERIKSRVAAFIQQVAST
ncbi:FBP domain-containing protein [Micromonospora sp. NPDC049081]|uniref:FBP domain-containing protein n=1 Tax=Micromonospora sp. NPDC049081 TaxID=3155150 RepID=UPI0033F14260